jgi:hypothetical protein
MPLGPAAVEAATDTSPNSGPVAAAEVPKPRTKEAASAFSQSGDKDGQAGVAKRSRSDASEAAEPLTADMYENLAPLETASEEEVGIPQTRGSTHCHTCSYQGAASS